jgi:hypothetical protein
MLFPISHAYDVMRLVRLDDTVGERRLVSPPFALGLLAHLQPVQKLQVLSPFFSSKGKVPQQ